MPPDDSPEDGASPRVSEVASPHYLDAADRLERVIDVQVDTLNGIDEKAEHVTRLVAVLLGVVLSVLSIVVRSETVVLSSPALSTGLAFLVGLGALLLSMIIAILTYLSSTFEAGPGRRVGTLLSDPDYSVDPETYVRRLLGAYGHVIRENSRVVAANARRFEWALVLLAVGVVYLTLASVLYVGRGVSGPGAATRLATLVAWTAVLATTGATVIGCRYVTEGRYFILREEGGVDD